MSSLQKIAEDRWVEGRKERGIAHLPDSHFLGDAFVESKEELADYFNYIRVLHAKGLLSDESRDDLHSGAEALFDMTKEYVDKGVQ
jgi:hypothetical protein